jgi:hypothetical protein
MKRCLIFAALLFCTPTLADERSAFIASVTFKCFQRHTQAAMDHGWTAEQLSDYCKCAARAWSDSITDQEFELWLQNKEPESMHRKTEAASNLCSIGRVDGR